MKKPWSILSCCVLIGALLCGCTLRKTQTVVEPEAIRPETTGPKTTEPETTEPETTEPETTELETTEPLPDLEHLPPVDALDIQLYSNLTKNGMYTPGEGYDSYYLWGDSSANMEAILTAVFDSYEWKALPVVNQGVEHDLICRCGDVSLQLRFVRVYYDNKIIGGTVQYSQDSEPESLTEEQVASIMYAVCQAYHQKTQTQPISAVKAMLGSWSSEDMKDTLELDENTMNGVAYKILLVTGNSICIDRWENGEKLDNYWITVGKNDITVSRGIVDECNGYSVMGPRIASYEPMIQSAP